MCSRKSFEETLNNVSETVLKESYFQKKLGRIFGDEKGLCIVFCGVRVPRVPDQR